MKTTDYRNTNFCPNLENVYDKKKSLEEQINRECPQTQIIYNKIKDKQKKYHHIFKEIYNYKCAYCGVDQKINKDFEIDHFVCESSYKGDTVSAGKINNLIFSCKLCNRNKKDFLITEEYVNILNPDNSNIANVFYRNQNYYIKIKNDYQSDSYIKAFYNKLNLGQQIRRLDYLLLNMYGLYEQIKDTEQGAKLAQCILELQKKRNNM